MGAIMLALGGMFFWMSWQAHETVIANTYVSSSNLAFSVEQFIARTVDTVDLSLRIVAEEVNLSGNQTSRETQLHLAERTRQFPQILSLVIVGPDGRIRYSSVQSSASPIDVADSKYFTLARDNAGLQLTVGEPMKLKPNGEHTIVASRRFTLPDGRFAGVIAATLNPRYVQRFFSTLNIGEHGIIALKTTDGLMLVRRPYAANYVGENFGSSVLFKRMLPWASSGVFPMRFEVDGVWRIVGYQRVEKLPLVVQVALSTDEALAHWRRTTFIQGTVGAAMLALFGAMAFMLHRQLLARSAAHAKLVETIGELERARSAAEESSRVKSQFLANMSHELRTPLNAIIGFSEVIRDAVVGPVAERYRDYARDIHNSGRHLLGLISDVLDLAKIEVGRLDLREDQVDLAKVAADCQRLIAERVTAGNLDLAIEVAPSMPTVLADELRLKQIVLNLLSNAVKFTRPGGRIVLSTSLAAEGGIDLAVSDTGIGMKPEDLPIALQPFRQLDGELNRRFEGTGLGLPLARTLAELHGGTLKIDSAPGRGTRVTITLPAHRVIRKAA